MIITYSRLNKWVCVILQCQSMRIAMRWQALALESTDWQDKQSNGFEVIIQSGPLKSSQIPHLTECNMPSNREQHA